MSWCELSEMLPTRDCLERALSNDASLREVVRGHAKWRVSSVRRSSMPSPMISRQTSAAAGRRRSVHPRESLVNSENFQSFEQWAKNSEADDCEALSSDEEHDLAGNEELLNALADPSRATGSLFERALERDAVLRQTIVTHVQERMAATYAKVKKLAEQVINNERLLSGSHIEESREARLEVMELVEKASECCADAMAASVGMCEMGALKVDIASCVRLIGHIEALEGSLDTISQKHANIVSSFI